MNTGGGTQTTTADLPSDWRRQVNDELRDALRELDADNNIKPDEFTAKEAIGIWRPSLSGTKKFLRRLMADGAVTMRKAYDPRSKTNVNAYKKV